MNVHSCVCAHAHVYVYGHTCVWTYMWRSEIISGIVVVQIPSISAFVVLFVCFSEKSSLTEMR